MDSQGPDLRRNAAVPTQQKAFSTAPRVLAMPKSAPLIAHLQGQGQDSQDSKAPEPGIRLHENKAANPFKLARSGYGGTGSGVSQGVIAGAEYARGPLQPTWAAELADRRISDFPGTPRHDQPLKGEGSLREVSAGAAAALLSAWQRVRQGLVALASDADQAEAGVQLADCEHAATMVHAGLADMSAALEASAKRLDAMHRPELLFCFPRRWIGRDLHNLVQLGTRPGRATERKLRFMDLAALVAAQLQRMTISLQEEKMWKSFTQLAIEEAEVGVLGTKQSFGRHLHLKGGATGQIQLMQDWEWPYMFALADVGFDLALRHARLGGLSSLRILEIGWGQGISGRRLLENAERAGNGLPQLQIEYEVVELHPAVAADARREAETRKKGTVKAFHVHEGPWQKILPELPAQSYNLLFYDPLNISPRYIGEQQRFENWGLPMCVFEALQFYRVLRPGGVAVQYAVSHRTSTVELLQRQVAPLFRALSLSRLSGLRAEANSSYVTAAEAHDLYVPAFVKNWGIRCQDRAAAVKVLSEVSQQLSERLLACDLRAIHLTLKLKLAVPGWVEPIKRGGHGQCDDVSRSAPLPDASNEPAVLLRTAQQLFDALAPDPVRLRGVGLAAKLGTASASSRSPQKAAVGTSSLTRWLKRGPSESLEKAAEAPTAALADSHIVVDLEGSEQVQEPDSRNRVECPVCSKLLNKDEADAHVNAHFECAEPPEKRLRLAVLADDSECELVE
ncbi:REV1 [Symbiodinium microadriaticum]|nr:REV1 [Symbiodinium microadriaticum]